MKVERLSCCQRVHNGVWVAAIGKIVVIRSPVLRSVVTRWSSRKVLSWLEPSSLIVNIIKNETTTAIGTYRDEPSAGTVTVTGKVDDGTLNSPISWAECIFVDLNGALHYSTTANEDGIYEFSNVIPDLEGHIRCNHPEIPKLQLSTFLNIESFAGEDPISGEDITPTTTVVAGIINSENPADPMTRRNDLFDAIENGNTELRLLVDLSTRLYKAMLVKQINVRFGDEYPGESPGVGGAGGDVGDGADFSPIPNARCDFALELEGEVLFSSALEDLRDCKLDRPDLAAIKEELEEYCKDPETREAFKKKMDELFPKGVGKSISEIADEDGKYSLPIPFNVQGFVRCAPPDQPNLKLAALVPKLQEEDDLRSDQDVTPQTTVFSDRIAKKLSGDLSDVKENYLDEIAGLRIGYTKENGDITEFEIIEPEAYLESEMADEGVGLVAYSATSLFNIFYQNETNADYLAALRDFIAQKEVDSDFLVDKLGLSKAEAENAAKIVNLAVETAEKDVLEIDLESALTTARINVTVLDRGTGVENANVKIKDDPMSGVECKDCPGETDEHGEVTLTLTGVPSDATEITVVTDNVSAFEKKATKTKVVAFATVNLEIAFSRELTVQGDGTGNGTVTSLPSGINCDISGGVAGGECSEYFDSDTDVTLTAIESWDSTFDGWSGGDCSETDICTVTMNQAHTVIATFMKIPVFSDYDSVVLADNPVGYWLLTKDYTGDASGNGLTGSYSGSATTQYLLPNGETVNGFNGSNNYFAVPDNDYLEVTRTGIITIEAWMRPDVLQFTNYESSGYVHWMGKGEGAGATGTHSWVARMYNLTNAENRPNRISGYSFNVEGGLGAGSYFQDTVTTTDWIQYTLVINTVDTNATYPTGYTKIFKNGVKRDQDSLEGYNIIPTNKSAPMRIGTRDFASYFEGAIGKVAIYDYELTERQLIAHYNEMLGLSSAYLSWDDFDAETVGNGPLNFSLVEASNTSATVSDSESVSTPNSMKLVDSNTGGAVKAIRNFITSTSPNLELKIKSPSEWVEVHVLGNSSYAARLYFKNDGKFYYYNGSYNYLADFNTSAWNSLRVYFNGQNSSFDVELNSTTVGTNISYVTGSIDLNTLRINTGSSTTVTGVYVDNVGIFEGTSPP